MTPSHLERTIGTVLRTGVVASSVCLAGGLVLSWLGRGGASDILFEIGILILLSTPVARVVVSIGEYMRERDWTFATLTTIVLLELAASVAAALVLNRRV